jgi:hypothetical protein
VEWVNGIGETFVVGLKSNQDYLELSLYGAGGDANYRVPITTTLCYFGGRRHWFICPLQTNGRYCGKRVGILYHNGGYFGCRSCLNLTYSSKNENRRKAYYPLFYIFRQSQKIEQIEKKMKREFYAGKLTKNARKIEKIYQKIEPLGKFVD